MIEIRNWQAKRAGGKITLVGTSVKDEVPVKVTGVDQIAGPTAKRGYILAVREATGEKWKLV